MSSSLTSAELVVLGLLVEQPRHGYELEAVISARGMREWTEIGFSSIYYILGRLRTRDLITVIEEERASHRNARKVYAPTEDGRRMCAEAAEAAIAELQPVFPHILVGLANLPVIPPERVAQALARRSDALAARMAAVREAAHASGDAPDHVRAIFDHSIGQLQAELAWLTEYRHMLPG